MTTFNITTDKMTHFDCRDLEDLIRSRSRNEDMTPTRMIWDNKKNFWTNYAPEMEWDNRS